MAEGSVVAPVSVRTVTPEKSDALWSPLVDCVLTSSLSRLTSLLVFPAVSVTVIVTSSSPSLNLSPASFAATAMDHALLATVAVFPPSSVAPLSNEIVTVEPSSAVVVPVMLKPAVFSATLISSSPAMTAMVAVGAVVSSVSVSVAVAVLPASSVTVAVTVTVPSDNVDISTSGTTQSLPTLDAERTIGDPTAASSIETDTEAASLSTPDSVMLI